MIQLKVQGNNKKIARNISKKIQKKLTSLKPSAPGDPMRGSDLMKEKKRKKKFNLFFFLFFFFFGI